MKSNYKFHFYDEQKKKSTVTDIDSFIENWVPKFHTWNQKESDSIITFDTETTVEYSTDSEGRKYPITGFVSMGQFCIDGSLIYCRTARECVALFSKISNRIQDVIKDDYYSIKKKNFSVRVYVHNLGYDWQFLKDFFEESGYIVSTILGDNRRPISIKFENKNISFYCSLKLFDKKLEKVAKDYKLPVLKSNGWNYNKFRTTKTPLDDKEIEYGMHDALILYYALQAKIKQGDYKYIGKVPSTKTGEVRYYRKNIVGKQPKIFKSFKEFKEQYPNAKDYSNLTDEEFNNVTYESGNRYFRNGMMFEYNKKYGWHYVTILTYDSRYIKDNSKIMTHYAQVYRLTQLAFTGGFTHANQAMLGRHLKNIASYDLTSAYPSVMLTKKFVYHWTKTVRSFSQIKLDSEGKIINDKQGYLMRLKLTNVEAKHGISVISHHKVEELEHEKGFKWVDNGRILKAKSFIVTCYDTDYNIWKDYYKWDKEELLEGYSGKKVRLLDSDLKTIIYFYTAKCYWKGEKKRLEGIASKEELDEIDIKLAYAKQQLNSVYGCAAMDAWKYADEGTDFKEFCKKTQEKDNAVSTYTIGGQVTSYVREQILTAIKMIGYEDMVYSDTDSIKFRNLEKHKAAFDKVNEAMQKELMETVKELNLDLNDWIVNGKEEFPNKFDYEGSYSDFKTLGAKRYIHTESHKGNILKIKDVYKTQESQKRFIDKNIDVNHEFIECTTAGCPKEDMFVYLWEGVNTLREAFSKYDKGILVTDTKKKTSLYVDNKKEDSNEVRTIVNNDKKYKIYKTKNSKIQKVDIIQLYEKGQKKLDTVYSASHIIIYDATFSIRSLAKDVTYAIGVNIGENIPDINCNKVGKLV